MAKIKYRDWNPKPAAMERVLQMNAILNEYNSRVSVRQLYYRLVAANLIPNKDDEYRKVQSICTDARYAGLIDWDHIEDRNREPIKSQEFDSGRSALQAIAQQFRLDRWEDQFFHLEIWVEKAALAGVLMPIAGTYHVTLMVNRGYSSASAMKESADRITHACRPNKAQPHGKRPVILYIGDHDPSGKDMLRDISSRLLEFGCPPQLDVRPLALTWEQIQKYNPPPNPVKLTDVRAAAYVEQYGDFSWEVDSLPPPTLDLLVRQAVNAYMDRPRMEAAITRENLIKAKIKKFAASFEEA